MRRETGRKKKGFTLIEVIVTLTILGIIAAIAIPTGIQYMEKARQTARDKVARSVFLAAQKSLTSRTSSGNSLPANDAGPVDVDKIDPAFKDTDANKANIVYLSLNQKDGEKKSKELFQLLDTYLADAEILDNTVLIEFNKKTGKVYSAFYSEVVSSIGYGASGAYNAYQRSEQARKDGKMGFWGVDSTGKAGTPGQDDNEANIQLVDYDVPNQEYYMAAENDEGEDRAAKGNNINHGKNYGLLTVECLLPENMMSVETLMIQLQSVDGGSDEFTIVNDEGQTTSASGDAKLSKIREKGSLDAAIENPFTKKTGADKISYPMYIETREADNRSILVLVLDSPLNGLSITKNHEALGKGDFTGNLIVKTLDGSTKMYGAPEGGMNKANALFGTAKTQDGNTAYAISSIRHLNNIRYMPGAGLGDKKAAANTIFAQTRDIYCRNYNGNRLKWSPIGEQGPTAAYPNNNPPPYTGDKDKDKENRYTWGKTNGFAGVYNGGRKTIYDISVFGADTQSGMVGLFACISADGAVTGVELDYSSKYEEEYNNKASGNIVENTFFIRGQDRVGGIAGENWGNISQCTVQGRFYGYGGEARVGAVVGKNIWDKDEGRKTGIVTQCASLAFVRASSTNQDDGGCAGGIAGDNYGAITYCESGTAATAAQKDALIKHIDRTPYFGVTMSDAGDFVGKYQTSVNDVGEILSKRCAGGIAGQNRASEWGKAARIQYCVNASKVTIYEPGTSDPADTGAGGIAGRYSRISIEKTNAYEGTEISSCYNAGTVEGSVYAGGIAGTFKENGDGSKGEKRNVIKSCYNTGNVVNLQKTNSRAGGILGCLGTYTDLSDCYNVGMIGNGKLNGENADGIFFGWANKKLSTCTHCIARKGQDPDHWNTKKNDGSGREFIGQGAVKKEEFSGMKSGHDKVGIFEYQYPYILVDDENACHLGEYFHRTPWSEK